jgi:glyoxylase-like metal-dependent hydrolase (beta-lactamase superfamily II)
MPRLPVAAVATASLFLAVTVSAAQQAPLQAAATELGVGGVRSLQLSAVGTRFMLSQGLWTAYNYLPARTIRDYQADLDFDTGTLRVESDTVTSPTTGYFVGDQHSVEMFSDGFAWSKASEPVGRPPDPGRPANQPQPDAGPERLFWLWAATPQGLMKAAASANATVRTVSGGTEATFTIGGRRVTAFIDQLHRVERVETLAPSPVLGDMRLTIRYTGYRQLNGIQFPSLISEYENDYPVFALAVTDLKVNPPTASLPVPDNVRAFKPAARTVKLQPLADGVYWVTGASHNSMLVDMGDFLTMVEAPLDEARSIAVMEAVRQQFPNKPIRYVVNTHVHFDHSGGLRTYVDAGATVVTQTINRAFYGKAWAQPRTLEPDRLSKSGRAAKFMAVDDHAEIKGSNGRTIQLYHLQGNPHDEENMVAWLPNEHILFEADMLNGNKYTAPEAHPTTVLTNFYDNLKRLRIEPQQIVGGHGQHITTMEDLNLAVGRGKAD